MPRESLRSEAPARVLALMVAANGRFDPKEMDTLESLDAFRRLGVPRQRFEALVGDCMNTVGHHLGECSWLRAPDQAYVDRLLDAVVDPKQRLLLCRLAAAVITADGRVSNDERLVYEHALTRWQVSAAMVAQAIREDALHRL
mgnify:CR=1 FL=1